MKHRHRIACLLAIVAFSLLGSGCRGVQIHQLERRVDQLEARVAVLESQAAAQTRR